MQSPAAAVDARRRAAHLDRAVLQLEDRSRVDHQGDASRHLDRGPVFQGTVLSVEADLEGKVVADRVHVAVGAAVGHHAHHLAELGGREGRRERAIGLGQAAVGPGPADGRLVDELRVLDRLDLEPEVVHAARDPVPIAVQCSARGVHDHRLLQGPEGQPQLVRAVAGAVEARPFDAGVEPAVATGADGDRVGARRQADLEERILAEIVVVARDQLVVIAHVPVEADDRVQGAAEAFGERLGGEQALLIHRERVQVDVIPFGPVQVQPVQDVVVARIDRLGGLAIREDGIVAHDRHRRQLVGVAKPQQVTDLVERDREPVAAEVVVPGLGVVHDANAVQRVGQPRHPAGPGVDRRLDGPQVAGHDGQPPGGRFDDLNTHVAAVHLEDGPRQILLGWSDRVVQRVSQRVKAVVAAEVVVDRLDARRAVRAEYVVVLHGHVAVAGLVVGPGEIDRVVLRINRAGDDLALASQHTQVVGRVEAVSRLGLGYHDLRRSLGQPLVRADPQPVDPRPRGQQRQVTGKGQHGGVGHRIVAHLDWRKQLVVGVGDRLVRKDQLIEVRVDDRGVRRQLARRHRRRVHVVVIEVHDDLIAGLGPGPARVAPGRLRHDGDHLGPQVKLEIERLVDPVVERVADNVPQRIRAGTDNGDPIKVIR